MGGQNEIVVPASWTDMDRYGSPILYTFFIKSSFYWKNICNFARNIV